MILIAPDSFPGEIHSRRPPARPLFHIRILPRVYYSPASSLSTYISLTMYSIPDDESRELLLSSRPDVKVRATYLSPRRDKNRPIEAIYQRGALDILEECAEDARARNWTLVFASFISRSHTRALDWFIRSTSSAPARASILSGVIYIFRETVVGVACFSFCWNL